MGYLFIKGGAGPSIPPPDPGLSSSFLTETGANVAWKLQTVDLSSYANSDIRLVWKVVVGTTGSVWQNDVQLDNINFDGNSYSFESTIESFQTVLSDPSATYEGGSWVDVQAADVDGYWCRDDGTTLSASTGTLTGQSGTWFLYTETSSPVANGDVFWLRSPIITCSASPGNCTFYEGRDVTGTTTTLDFYVDVQS